MNPYFQLLRELGIDQEDESEPESEKEYLEFQGENIELWEFYDRAGMDDIRHASEMGIIKEYGLDYKDEQGRDWVR